MSFYEGRHTRLASAIAGIVPASISSAAIGVACLGAYMLLFDGALGAEGAGELLGLLVLGGMALLIGWVAAIFVVAFYLALFGLPIALLLGERIRHPLAIAVALLDAVLSALIVVSGSALNLFNGQAFHLPTFGIVLAFALPAGVLYRRNVIAMRDEAEVLA